MSHVVFEPPSGIDRYVADRSTRHRPFIRATDKEDNMMNISQALLIGPIAVAAGTASAQTVYYPGDGITDTTDPIGVFGDAAPGFGTGSFQANGATKTAINMSPEILFGSGASFTIDDIANISFWTKQTVLPSDPGTYLNWYLEIYTATEADGQDDSWYRKRINFEPYFSPDLSDANQPANSWVQWSTDASANQLRVFDANRGASGSVFGTYTDPFLTDLQAGPVNWSTFNAAYSSTPATYETDSVWFMAISTGSGWASGFDGQVDGVTVTLTNGQIATIDFEAIPAPGAASLFALAGLAVSRRRRS
ncbi:MAG: hypothetical protein COB69_00630 [Phycisphaera sp.]|nr:MAG: hypothetical protein COB69_00630 [Phycisphaera sp.]